MAKRSSSHPKIPSYSRGRVQKRAVTTTTDTYGLGMSVFNLLLSPPEPEQSWDVYDLGREAQRQLSPRRLLRILADTAPDVSRALWDALRFCNPGWTCVVNSQGEQDAIAVKGQAILDGMLTTLGTHYGSPDVVFNRLFMGAWLSGGFFTELVLENGRTFADLVTPDPTTVRFKATTDPLRGQIWKLYQLQGTGLTFVDVPTVRYIPIDPFPDSPYGRSPFAPALFVSLFILGMLHDIKRVIAQQGWPRLDLQINLEKVLTAMPEDVRADPDGAKAWITAFMDEIGAVYSALEPDDAYIHTDEVTINTPKGVTNDSSLGSIDGIIVMLERMVIRALKTMPLLFGVTEGMSDSAAIRQWEIYVAGIKSFQHMAENLLEGLFNLLLQANAIPRTCMFRFAELRASEMLRDAQTDNMRIANANAKYQAGWYTQDEASKEITGKPAAEPEPRTSAKPASAAPGVATINPEPGAKQ